MEAHSGGSTVSWQKTRISLGAVDVVTVCVVVELVEMHELHLTGQSLCSCAIVTGFVQNAAVYNVHVS